MYPEGPCKVIVSFAGRAERRRRRALHTLAAIALAGALAAAWLVPSPLGDARARQLSADLARFNAAARAVMTARCHNWPSSPEPVRYAAAWRALIVAQQAAGDRDADDLTPPDTADVRRLEAAMGDACARKVLIDDRDELAASVVPHIYETDPSLHE